MELKNFFAQDTAGNVIAEPTAYLYEPGTTTLVNGVVDKDGDLLANPMTGTVNGLIQFAAPDGEYDLRVVGASRDFTIRIQCLDASEVVAAAEAARDAAQDAQAAAEVAADGAAGAATAAVAAANLSALADVADTAPTNAQRLKRNAGTGLWEPVSQLFDVMVSQFDTLDASVILVNLKPGVDLQLPANLSGSTAFSEVAATASAVFSLQKNGTEVATITFDAAATTGTLSTQAAVSFAATDKITLVAPATPDATLASVAFRLQFLEV